MAINRHFLRSTPQLLERLSALMTRLDEPQITSASVVGESYTQEAQKMADLTAELEDVIEVLTIRARQADPAIPADIHAVLCSGALISPTTAVIAFGKIGSYGCGCPCPEPDPCAAPACK